MNLPNDARPETTVAPPNSRRGLLRTGLAAACVAAIPLLGAPKDARAGGYNAGRSPNVPRPRNAREFQSILQHERDHVTFLVGALGAAARPKPTFQNLLQNDFASFARVSQALENTGVGAYLNAVPAITSKSILSAAGSIALVEARHAGFLNVFNDAQITATFAAKVRNPSFDRPLTPAQVRAAAGPFVASLNGGPAVDYTVGDDISILNYALALEYLEAEFYEVNVRRFF